MKNILEKYISPLTSFFDSLDVVDLEGEVISLHHRGDEGDEISFEIFYEKKCYGHLKAKIINDHYNKKALEELLAHLSPIVRLGTKRGERLINWVESARKIKPELCDWIGLYFKESYVNNSKSNDLILGPFLGASTDHVRIPLNRGFCGLALSEERVVNVEDVAKDTRHIACSITTRSELVIPLSDNKGNFVAELDIDSNQLASFKKEIEELFTTFSKSFHKAL